METNETNEIMNENVEVEDNFETEEGVDGNMLMGIGIGIAGTAIIGGGIAAVKKFSKPLRNKVKAKKLALAEKWIDEDDADEEEAKEVKKVKEKN